MCTDVDTSKQAVDNSVQWFLVHYRQYRSNRSSLDIAAVDDEVDPSDG